MLINVKVIPNSSMVMVQTELDGSLKVKLTAPAQKNKANQQLIEVLAKHFNVKKNLIRIVKGLNSKEKVVEVLIWK